MAKAKVISRKGTAQAVELAFNVTQATNEIVTALENAISLKAGADAAFDNATGAIRDWLVRGFKFCEAKKLDFVGTVVEPLLGNTKRDKTASKGSIRTKLDADGVKGNAGNVAATQGRAFARWLCAAPAEAQAEAAKLSDKGQPTPLKELYKMALKKGHGTGKPRKAKEPVVQPQAETVTLSQLIAKLGPATVLREVSAVLLTSKATKLQAETCANIAAQLAK